MRYQRPGRVEHNGNLRKEQVWAAGRSRSLFPSPLFLGWEKIQKLKELRPERMAVGPRVPAALTLGGFKMDV